MAVADYEGRVSSLMAVENIDDGIAYFVFKIPDPMSHPIGMPERDCVFYYDLNRSGAFAAVAVVTAAFYSGKMLQLRLIFQPVSRIG